MAGADRGEAPGPKSVRLGPTPQVGFPPLRLRRQPPGSWQLWNGGVQRGVSRPADPACEEEGPNMDGVGRLWRCGLSVFEPPGVPGSDRLGWKNGLDGERMTAADHPGEMANDHRRIETSDRGGFGDGEAAVNQARGPLLGRHVLRCSVGAGLREGRDHHGPGSRWRDGIARLLPSADGIRLGGSLALPARRSGNRTRERGDCMK